jgi:hypothetical protein
MASKAQEQWDTKHAFCVAKGLVYNCEHCTTNKATQHKVNRILIEHIDLLDFFFSIVCTEI